MTSGQGGQYGEPTGPPGPPPGQGGAPQGWNAPPPQQSPQPYGYGAAPSAPAGYGAPQPVERPVTVRAGIGAFVANLILGVIASIITFADFDTLIRDAMAATNDPNVTEDVIRSGLVLGLVIALVLVALNIMFLWFAWNGRNWARIVLWVLGGLSVVSGLFSLGGAGATGQNGFLTAIGFFQLLLVIAGIVLLALKPSNEWYRYQSWRRATAQR